MSMLNRLDDCLEYHLYELLYVIQWNLLLSIPQSSCPQPETHHSLSDQHIQLSRRALAGVGVPRERSASPRFPHGGAAWAEPAARTPGELTPCRAEASKCTPACKLTSAQAGFTPSSSAQGTAACAGASSPEFILQQCPARRLSGTEGLVSTSKIQYNLAQNNTKAKKSY
ncbi:uncharacterized protein LOC112984386 isoform X3 [Dromaius novaehollandiae]|uniref:uncharacterized protein LOC112984386 isoform X3 n=1 Tax=Dromaius novaehollandiae TaxID=8790 RepID=UPI0031201D6E